jgi:hypothetical protein
MRFCIFFLFISRDDDHHFCGGRYRSLLPTVSGFRLDQQICRSSEIRDRGDLDALRATGVTGEFFSKDSLIAG